MVSEYSNVDEKHFLSRLCCLRFIPSKILSKHIFSSDIEGIFMEINFKKVKWLVFGTYHPSSQSGLYFLKIQVEL